MRVETLVIQAKEGSSEEGEWVSDSEADRLGKNYLSPSGTSEQEGSTQEEARERTAKWRQEVK